MAATLVLSGQEKVYIPDNNFRTFLVENYPTAMDISGDSLLTDSAAVITGTMDCSNQHIADLTGIGYFEIIEELNCSYNLLSTLPALSENVVLVTLNCHGNELTELPDLSSNTALTHLYCSSNELVSLPDLSANTMLIDLYCNNNYLSSLPDLATNTQLVSLNCADNELVSLPDLSANIGLQLFACSSNHLTSVPDLSANINLDLLILFENQLTSIPDLSYNTALRIFNCSDNQLNSLPDLSSNELLTNFYCVNNYLDFSDARELRIIDALADLTEMIMLPQYPFGDDKFIYSVLGDTVLLSIAPQDSAVSYQWFRSGTPIEGETDTLMRIDGVEISDVGTYTCKAYSSSLLSPPLEHGPGIGEFVSAPQVIYVEIPESTKETNFAENIKLFPNPTNGMIYIESDQFSMFELYTAMGMMVIKSNERSVDFMNLEKGIYFINLIDIKGNQCTKKIIHTGY